jgi:hypothetical protein
MVVAAVMRGADSSHIYGSNFGDPEDMAPDSNRFLGPTLLAIYLLISSIVLTNLLIAMVCATVIELEGRVGGEEEQEEGERKEGERGRVGGRERVSVEIKNKF